MRQLHRFSSFDNPALITRSILGHLGEQTVMRDFRQSGLRAQKLRNKQSGDVLVRDAHGFSCKVEVKTAMRGKRGTFQFCLFRQIKHGRVCTDHTHADILVLLAVEDDGSYTVFVVPTAAVSTLKIEFADPTKNKYSAFKVS